MNITENLNLQFDKISKESLNNENAIIDNNICNIYKSVFNNTGFVMLIREKNLLINNNLFGYRNEETEGDMIWLCFLLHDLGEHKRILKIHSDPDN